MLEKLYGTLMLKILLVPMGMAMFFQLDTPVLGQQFNYWQGTGDWNLATNWSLGDVPDLNNIASITGTAEIYSDVPAINTLYLGAFGDGVIINNNGKQNVDSSTSPFAFVGAFGSKGDYVMFDTGAELNLNGPSLLVGSFGGDGRFHQLAGRVKIQGPLIVGDEALGFYLIYPQAQPGTTLEFEECIVGRGESFANLWNTGGEVTVNKYIRVGENGATGSMLANSRTMTFTNNATFRVNAGNFFLHVLGTVTLDSRSFEVFSSNIQVEADAYVEYADDGRNIANFQEADVEIKFGGSGVEFRPFTIVEAPSNGLATFRNLQIGVDSSDAGGMQLHFDEDVFVNQLTILGGLDYAEFDSGGAKLYFRNGGNSLRALIPGDANLDGVVDVSDFNIWNENKFTSGTDWSTGDFNGDRVTDISDFNVWNTHKLTGPINP